jgi:hypothetical protein
MLLNEGQVHLFQHWPEPGVEDDKKEGFFKQVCVHAQNIPRHYEYYIHEYSHFVLFLLLCQIEEYIQSIVLAESFEISYAHMYCFPSTVVKYCILFPFCT